MKHVPFVILFHPRSGSSWLRSILAANDGFEMEYEPLFDIPAPELQRQFAVERLTTDRGPSIQAAGFKISPYQIVDKPDFVAFLNEASVKVVMVLRDDLVRTAISEIRRGELQITSAARSGVAHTNLFNEADRPGASHIGNDQLLCAMRECLKSRNDCRLFAAGLVRRPLQVTYETMMADLPGELTRISKYLGVPIEPRPSDLFKNTPDDLRTAVANYDEMIAGLRASPLSRFAPASFLLEAAH